MHPGILSSMDNINKTKYVHQVPKKKQFLWVKADRKYHKQHKKKLGSISI